MAADPEDQKLVLQEKTEEAPVRLYEKALQLQAKKKLLQQQLDAECTFTPSTNVRKGKGALKARSGSEASKSLYDSAAVAASKRKAAEDAHFGQHTFKPEISKKSKELSDRPKGRVFEALLKRGEAAKARIQARREAAELEGCTFSPMLTAKAKAVQRQGKAHDRLYDKAWLVKRNSPERNPDVPSHMAVGCTFKPQVNTRSKDKSKRTGPVFERLYAESSAKLKAREAAAAKKQEAELAACTFTPVTGKKKGSKKGPSDGKAFLRLQRQASDWSARRVHGKQPPLDDCPFTPQISAKSRSLSSRRASEGSPSVTDRLYHSGLQTMAAREAKHRESMLKRQEAEAAACTFTPSTSPHKPGTLDASGVSVHDRLYHNARLRQAQLEALELADLDTLRSGPSTVLPSPIAALREPAQPVVLRGSSRSSSISTGHSSGDQVGATASLEALQAHAAALVAEVPRHAGRTPPPPGAQEPGADNITVQAVPEPSPLRPLAARAGDATATRASSVPSAPASPLQEEAGGPGVPSESELVQEEVGFHASPDDDGDVASVCEGDDAAGTAVSPPSQPAIPDPGREERAATPQSEAEEATSAGEEVGAADDASSVMQGEEVEHGQASGEGSDSEDGGVAAGAPLGVSAEGSEPAAHTTGDSAAEATTVEAVGEDADVASESSSESSLASSDTPESLPGSASDSDSDGGGSEDLGDGELDLLGRISAAMSSQGDSGTMGLVHAQTDCPGSTPNTLPIYDAAPTFVANSTWGSRWETGSPALPYGTPYQMGFAYGELMKNEIRSLFPKMETWIMNEINSAIGELPAPVRNWIDTYGIPAALNFTLYATGPHIPEHYWQLAYGLGNSTGLGWHKIMTTSLFPELIKAHCSMMGAWGEATAGIPGAGLVQLRALDWSTNGPFQEYPLLVTYHPEEGEGYTHTVLGWAGMMGAITGMGSNGMGVSEKVWLHYKGTQNVFGYPFPFLMQDLMWKCMDTDQALSKIASANRTCSIFIGIGDAKNNQFRALEYSHQTVNIYNDVNFPAYPPYHPLLKDLVFIDKHTQPSHHMCFGSLMEKLYGKLSPQNIISYVTALQQTGDTHAAVYDFGTSTMYVSNASPFVNGSATPAYNMPWSSLNMTQQWTLPPPTAV